MPTATTTATDALRGVIKEVGAGQLSNQERWSGGPAEGVHFRKPGAVWNVVENAVTRSNTAGRCAPQPNSSNDLRGAQS